MSNHSTPPAGGKKNSRPDAPKGAQREGHRGYRADPNAAATKKRWSADDRAARTGDRPNGASRAAAPDRRPDWTPREGKAPYQARGAQNRGADGRGADGRGAPDRGVRDAAAQDRGARPSYGDRKPDRPAYADRPARPAYNDRAERPAYNDRAARPAYNERATRPAANDRAERSAPRPDRGDRPSYQDRGARPTYNDRGARPAYNDRAERAPYSDRSDRPARPTATDRPARSYDADRPARSYDSDRPARPTATDRPARSYDNDRPARSHDADRPARSYDADRPARSYDAGRAARPASDRPAYADRASNSDRPPYNNRAQRSDGTAYNDRAQRAPRRDTDDRPARRESDFYTARAVSGPVEDVVLGRLEAAAITAGEVDGVTFGDLGLGSNIVRQLASMGAEAPFAIQAATIPDVLAGKDVLGRGKTGSGKTIAFGAPMVERLMENNGGKDRQMGRKPRALILAPTRELAMQIDRTVQPIARSVGLFTTTIVGGVPQYKQVSALQRGVDIVIATPGRVEDLIEQGRLDLSNVFVTVLDEADHMCDLGFLEPVQRILRETKDGGQKLLFSATLDKGVATLVEQFLVDPAVHEVAGEDQASSSIDHKVLLIEQRDKREIIQQLASGEGRTLIFTRTRAFAEEMSDYLEDAGIPATSLHGDLNQSRRTRNLSLLTSGRVNVLVATDVAARGIHVDDISLVIQADAPEEYKTYLHRSGRTGRAGKVGTVVTLVNRNRRRKMDELLGRAEIDATSVYAAPGDALLGELAAL